MVAASVGSWLAATAVVGRQTGIEVLFGMLAPLAVVTGTWVLAERTYRRNPERLTALMITFFVGKMAFFGAYVAVMLAVLKLRAIPFVVSFTSYFIGLYLIEALCLRRLFASGTT
jgi:hypothetical protein